MQKRTQRQKRPSWPGAPRSGPDRAAREMKLESIPSASESDPQWESLTYDTRKKAGETVEGEEGDGKSNASETGRGRHGDEIANKRNETH